MIQDPAAARRYAQAVVPLAHGQGQLDALLDDLAAIQQLIERQPMLARLLANPEVEVADKRELLTRLLKARVTPLALRLILVLLWKGRLPLLPLVVAEGRQLRDEVQGIARGVARSARPLPAATLKALEQRLGRRLGKQVILTPAVDPSLIGGVAVSLDNTVFDGSVRRMLEVLRERLAAVRVA